MDATGSFTAAGRHASGPRRLSVNHEVDVLIPTFVRPASLAVTLAGLVGQTLPRFRVIVSDQTEEAPSFEMREVAAVVRTLEATGRPVALLRHLPRRGMAEHRDSLLRLARAPYALFLDDDVLLEHDLLERLLAAIRRAGSGFVGSALVGPSYLGDVRPDEQRIEFWPDDEVRPEEVRPGTSEWERYRLHNAANLHHVRRAVASDGARPTDRLYKVAWIGGCVLYDVEKLRSVGGFGFWRELPERHAGEDVLAQLRLMRRFGGAGLFPSGAYHLELPTTIPDREVDAPRVLTP